MAARHGPKRKRSQALRGTGVRYPLPEAHFLSAKALFLLILVVGVVALEDSGR